MGRKFWQREGGSNVVLQASTDHIAIHAGMSVRLGMRLDTRLLEGSLALFGPRCNFGASRQKGMSLLADVSTSL